MIGARTRGQFVRYSLVGLGSNLLLYLAYLGLTATGVGHKLAMTSLYVTGVLLTFLLNRSWSFAHSGPSRGALVRYLIAYALGYALNWAILWLAVDTMHLPHQVVQAGAIFVVATALFLMHKFWVFASSGN